MEQAFTLRIKKKLVTTVQGKISHVLLAFELGEDNMEPDPKWSQLSEVKPAERWTEALQSKDALVKGREGKEGGSRRKADRSLWR